MDARLRPRLTDHTHRVTTLELFFDLVFVFAITQTTALMADNLTWSGLLRGLVIMGLLWWSWTGFAWLGNVSRADQGVLRAGLLASMAALFVAALAIPESFDDLPGGLNGPLVLAVSLSILRLVFIAVFDLVAADDPGMRRSVRRMGAVQALASGLLIAGALAGPPWQVGLWIAALVVDYGGVYLIGTSGWRVASAAHFAERHGLIVIVVLGESLVATGLGVAELPVSTTIVVTSLLGLVLVTALWWIYFDVTALEAEHFFGRRDDAGRSQMARDAYTYAHFPLVASVVYIALGLKKVNAYAGDAAEHELSESLPLLAAVALAGGVAVFLAAQVAFRLLSTGRLSRSRVVASGVLVVAVPLVSVVPALAALGLVTAVVVALVAVEALADSDFRHHVRET